jgi:hypothetical protein
MTDAPKRRGRPLVDKDAVTRERRRVVLLSGMTSCYEIIDMVRKELAELDAADARAKLIRLTDGRTASATEPPFAAPFAGVETSEGTKQ